MHSSLLVDDKVSLWQYILSKCFIFASESNYFKVMVLIRLFLLISAKHDSLEYGNSAKENITFDSTSITLLTYFQLGINSSN